MTKPQRSTISLFAIAIAAGASLANPSASFAQTENETKVIAAYEESAERAIKYLTTVGMNDDGSYHRQADPGLSLIHI